MADRRARRSIKLQRYRGRRALPSIPVGGSHRWRIVIRPGSYSSNTPKFQLRRLDVSRMQLWKNAKQWRRHIFDTWGRPWQ